MAQLVQNVKQQRNSNTQHTRFIVPPLVNKMAVTKPDVYNKFLFYLFFFFRFIFVEPIDTYYYMCGF